MVDYSETIEVYSIQVDIFSKQNEYIETCIYQRSTSFFDHCPRSLLLH